MCQYTVAVTDAKEIDKELVSWARQALDASGWAAAFLRNYNRPVADSPGDDIQRTARFFEIFESVPRGGPGDPASTGRALAMMGDLPAHPRVLDLGCGPGAGSSNLASLTGGRVAALDLHAPFVAQQAAAARAAGLSNRLDPVCADMRAAPFRDGAFDLVWSEGALYSIGFRNGLELCARLVKPGGYVAASEVVWTVDAPPDEVRRWWHAEYPDIAPIAEKAAVVTGADLEIIDHFTLPREAWTRYFYEPMKARLGEFRRAWSSDAAGLGVIAQLDTEIDMYERWSHVQGYEFFVARRPHS